MKPERGWYSLIQFCPDPSRAEAANVGVLLLSPAHGFLRGETIGSNDRIRRFFGQDPEVTIDLQRVNAEKAAFVRRLEAEAPRIQSLEALQEFIDTRAHTLQVTTPRSLRVEDPEATLHQLLQELVGGRRRDDRPKPLHETFARLKKERSSIEFDRAVEIPQLGIDFTAEYAYQNGTLNLVRLLSLAAEDTKTVRRALRVAAESGFVDRHSGEAGEQAQVIVVSAPGDTPDPAVVERSLRTVFLGPAGRVRAVRQGARVFPARRG